MAPCRPVALATWLLQATSQYYARHGSGVDQPGFVRQAAGCCVTLLSCQRGVLVMGVRILEGIRDFADTSALYRLMFLLFCLLLRPFSSLRALIGRWTKVCPGDRQISRLVRPKPHWLLSMATPYTEALGMNYFLRTSC